MKIFFIAALLIFLNVSPVAGGCRDNSKGITDYTEKCQKWWNKMMADYDENNKIRRCVFLIRAKCSSFLVIRENIEIKHWVYRYSIKWTFKHKAVEASNSNRWANYRITKKTGVCKNDDGLGNCDIWWNAATVLKEVDHVVERCINRMKQRCPSDLTQMSENKQRKWHFLSKVTVVTLTYRYRTREELTFRRYE